VVDADFRVIMCGATDVWRSVGIAVAVGMPVPSAVAAVVDRELHSWDIRLQPERSLVASPWPGIIVSIFGIDTERGPSLAVTAERFTPRTDLRWASNLFALTTREGEVLRQVLLGLPTPRIAVRLGIAESTVIAHIKSLLIKTRAANRAELVARVLGWVGGPA
jgi:DNA-binding CsgD family transcriptional regulator